MSARGSWSAWSRLASRSRMRWRPWPARLALASEADRLNIRPGGDRAHHRRIFRADECAVECAVETVGIIIPVSGTYSSTYRSSGLHPGG
jgi:hypothetical protein